MGQTIVVTGGGSGIGAAVVRRLVADGAHVTVVGRRKEPLSALRDELGDSVAAVSADVSTPAGAAAVAEQVDGCAGVVAAATSAGTAVRRMPWRPGSSRIPSSRKAAARRN
jgi:3-oxoacyl-[acyl-carrier protein] reductase